MAALIRSFENTYIAAAATAKIPNRVQKSRGERRRREKDTRGFFANKRRSERCGEIVVVVVVA